MSIQYMNVPIYGQLLAWILQNQAEDFAPQGLPTGLYWTTWQDKLEEGVFVIEDDDVSYSSLNETKIPFASELLQPDNGR